MIVQHKIPAELMVKFFEAGEVGRFFTLAVPRIVIAIIVVAQNAVNAHWCLDLFQRVEMLNGFNVPVVHQVAGEKNNVRFLLKYQFHCMFKRVSVQKASHMQIGDLQHFQSMKLFRQSG